MANIKNLLEEISEDVIAQRVTILHDNIRARYQQRSNIITDFPSFIETITDYYNYHFQHAYNCNPLSHSDAQGKARTIVDRAYGQDQNGLTIAFQDAKNGFNSGLKRILDVIAESIKREHVDYYIESVFDRYVDPDDPNSMTEIMRQFMAKYGYQFGAVLYNENPEFYARNYKKLIKEYAQMIKEAASSYRRI